MNIFHKIVIFIALVIVGVGIFQALEDTQSKKFDEISSIAAKYKLVGFENISGQQSLLSKSFSKNLTASTLNIELNESYNEVIVKLKSTLNYPELYILKFADDYPIQAIQKDLNKTALVEFAEKNEFIALENIGSQASSITSQDFSKIESNAANQIKVAIIDSGIDVNHTELKDLKIKLKTFRGGLSDEVGHGTHLAGIILKEADNIELYSYKFTNGKVGKLGDLLKAIFAASKDDINIVNFSLGLPVNTESLRIAIEYLQKQGTLVVAAAGNQNSDKEFYPAALPGVIGVAGLDDSGKKLTQSNYGAWIDYSIDGQDWYSLAPESKYKYLTGTSQSAAVITGKLANLMANDSNLSQEDIYNYFLEQRLEVDDNFNNLLGVRVRP